MLDLGRGGSGGAVGAHVSVILVSSVACRIVESTPGWTSSSLPSLNGGRPILLLPSRSYPTAPLHPPQHVLLPQRPCSTLCPMPPSSLDRPCHSRCHRRHPVRCRWRPACCTFVLSPCLQITPDLGSSSASIVPDMCIFSVRRQLTPMSMRGMLSRG